VRIAVVPEELRSLGAKVHGIGADVVATRGVLMGAVEGAGAATGVPEAAAAFEDMCAAWSGALGRCGGSIEAAGGAATAAAGLYELVDSTVMPLLGGGD
jgi:hypothetical protein